MKFGLNLYEILTTVKHEKISIYFYMQNNIQDWYNFLLNSTVCAKLWKKTPKRPFSFATTQLYEDMDLDVL